MLYIDILEHIGLVLNYDTVLCNLISAHGVCQVTIQSMFVGAYLHGRGWIKRCFGMLMQFCCLHILTHTQQPYFNHTQRVFKGRIMKTYTIATLNSL